MPIAARLAIAVWALLGAAGSVWGRDIIYIPDGFPGVCAESLSTGQHYCPPGTERVTPFCSENLPYLRQWARSVGLELCGGSAPTAGAINVDQVLLVDDRNMSSPLDDLLAPVTRDLRVWEKSGPFRDRENVVRSVWVVGEGSAAVSAPPMDGVIGREAPVSTDEPGTGNGQGPDTGAPDAGQPGDDGLSGSDDQQVSGDDSAEPQPNGTEPASSRCVPGQPFEPLREEKWLRIVVGSDREAPIWFRIAQALYPYMVPSRANELVRDERDAWMDRHSGLPSDGLAQPGETLEVGVTIWRRPCDRRVEDIDIWNYRATTAAEGEESVADEQESGDDSAEPQPNGTDPTSSPCVPGQAFEPIREQRTHYIEYSASETRFWTRIVQALSLDMPWNVANDFVIKAAFGVWRDHHATMRRRGFQAGQAVSVNVLYSRRPCDRRVQYVSILRIGYEEP
jgi:hypothetical protein